MYKRKTRDYWIMDERELCVKMIRDVLDHEGIKLNTELTDEFGVLDYLLSCDEEYTIYDYIDETKEWYPEYFKKPLKLT